MSVLFRLLLVVSVAYATLLHNLQKSAPTDGPHDPDSAAFAQIITTELKKALQPNQFARAMELATNGIERVKNGNYGYQGHETKQIMGITEAIRYFLAELHKVDVPELYKRYTIMAVNGMSQEEQQEYRELMIEVFKWIESHYPRLAH